MNIYENIGEPAMLEQIAEEASELAHASLKLARVLRGENPTPVQEANARRALLEEIADVTLCIDEWLRNRDPGYVDIINAIMDEKEERWVTRLAKE